MPVPDFQSLMLPVLKATADGGINASDLRDRVATMIGLTETDLAELLPSGRQTTFANRTAWANIFLQRAGLIEKTRPVAGAVCAPATGEIWLTTAEGAMKRRIGSTVLDPVRVRPWPKGEAVALVSHTMKEETAARLAAQYGFDLRTPMDSSVKLCRIAEGTADIYPRHGPTSEWDIAAGHAVLEAAGGSLTTPEGEPLAYGKAGERFLNGWFVARGG